MGVCVSYQQPNLLSVYKMKAILEVLIKAPRDVCVFVHARSRVGMDMCMRVCLQFPISTRQLLVCLYGYIC